MKYYSNGPQTLGRKNANMSVLLEWAKVNFSNVLVDSDDALDKLTERFREKVSDLNKSGKMFRNEIRCIVDKRCSKVSVSAVQECKTYTTYVGIEFMPVTSVASVHDGRVYVTSENGRLV